LKYCLDTSALTTAWRYHYPPAVFPALWRDIEHCITKGELIAPDEVLGELEEGGDELYDWAVNRPNLFVPPNALIQKEVSRILAHPEHVKLLYSKHATSRVIADPFVIATAKIHDCSVVSAEVFQAGYSPNKTKIPNVCSDMGIEHLSVIEFIYERGWIY
jgi:hypothetical protein